MRSALATALRMSPVFFLLLGATAQAQTHERQEGAYLLQSSTVGTENLSPETARAQGIERSPHRAVINVTLMEKKGDSQITVPADITVIALGLTGRRMDIGMKNTASNGWISYMGTYDFTHGEVLDFTIIARPKDSQQTLKMTYRDRMWAQGDPVP